MSPTISNTAGTTILVADLRLGYDGVSTESRNIVHTTLSGTAVTLRDDTPRRGRLSLFFALESDAWAAFDALAVADVWELVDDVTAVDMRFVRDASMSPIQQDNRARWVLEVGFQEVPA